MEKISLRLTQDYETLEKIAADCWHSAYDGLLGKEQVAYMLEKFQSAPAMREQTQEQRYSYYFICRGDEIIGYCALQDQGEDLFLSKLYLCESERGRGVGQEALAEVIAAAKKAGARRVYLTVNKHNARAVRSYEKFGFLKEREERTPIGNGYYMDDFVYGFRL